MKSELTEKPSPANEGRRTEIAERKRAEALLDGQKRVLEMIAANAALEESLTALMRLIESQVPGLVGSILLLDEKGVRLSHGAAPSLPAEYVKAIDGSVIGPNTGSCGTAAYRREAVFVRDIATDPLWKDYRDVALPHGLRACWSTPIFDTQRHAVVGTFAMYYRQAALPEPEHLRLIEMTTHIASIAICRHRIEAAVRESQQLLNQVLAALPVGVVVTDLAGDIVLTNATSKHIWGDMVVAGRERWAKSNGFWHDSGEPVASADWASVRALTKGETSSNELIDIETFDGQRKIILNSAAPIRNAEGQIAGAVIVNEDVTELKTNEEKLRQTEAELAHVARLTMAGELTASIAHEVNQPLAAVVTNANAVSRWLAAEPPNLEEAREAVKRIARDGNRASEVIKRMRALVKKGEPARKPLDFNELVEETVSLAKPELTRKKVSLKTELAPGLPLVPADRVQMQQVLLNLVVNAVDSLSAVTGRQRILCIRTEHPESDGVCVAVQDTGMGIKPEDLGRLFEPFYTTKPNGLGMGLAVSRSIVEAHGGRLWAAPNHGHGATFQFTLPIHDGGGS